MSRNEIFKGVCECLIEVLDISSDGISESSKLIDDLGADSLDLLDLIFHLEQRFKIQLSVRSMEKWAQTALEGAPVEIDGVYTPEALKHIRQNMPEVPIEELPDGIRVQDLPRRFRVSTMVNLVTRALETQHE